MLDRTGLSCTVVRGYRLLSLSLSLSLSDLDPFCHSLHIHVTNTIHDLVDMVQVKEIHGYLGRPQC